MIVFFRKNNPVMRCLAVKPLLACNCSLGMGVVWRGRLRQGKVTHQWSETALRSSRIVGLFSLSAHISPKPASWILHRNRSGGVARLSEIRAGHASPVVVQS